MNTQTAAARTGAHTKRTATAVAALALVLALLAGLTTQTLAASTYIGEDEAKAVALEHSGVAESEASFVKLARYDKRGVVRYDLEFLTASRKYSYEIDAVTGKVLSHHSKSLKRPGAPSDGGAEYIGFEKAKAIALTHAGVADSDVRKYESELDRENGRMIYEIEFVSGRMEYEYEIDAVTGDILDWEKERD